MAKLKATKGKQDAENADQLNEKQLRFCHEYLIDCNGTQAAIRSGYSEATATSMASRLLTNVKVLQKINELKAEIAEKLKIDASWIMARFKEISDRCMAVTPVMVRTDEGWVKSGEYQFDSSGANKATEMLGKMIGVFEIDNKQKAVQSIKFVRERNNSKP